MRGTAIIATIHGIVTGIAVALLGVPLAVPLGVLVFLGAFIPFIGTLGAGGLVVLVTFGSQGWLAALILLGVLFAQSQLETHLMQPMIVGRFVRLHPLAIGLAFAVGTVLAGIIGAIIAVPVAAVIYQAVPALRGQRPAPAPATEIPGERPLATGDDAGERRLARPARWFVRGRSH